MQKGNLQMATMLFKWLLPEILISYMFPRPEVQRDHSEGENDIFIFVYGLGTNITS